ncbi:hypothetical protein DKP78_19765, partial [Enterococcus faecium]
DLEGLGTLLVTRQPCLRALLGFGFVFGEGRLAVDARLSQLGRGMFGVPVLTLPWRGGVAVGARGLGSTEGHGERLRIV